MGRDSATQPSPSRCARPLAQFRQFAVLAVSWTVTHAPSVASHKLKRLHEMPRQAPTGRHANPTLVGGLSPIGYQPSRAASSSYIVAPSMDSRMMSA